VATSPLVEIDGEVTTFDPLGLHSRTAADDDIAVWAFDLLFHDCKDMRQLPLVEPSRPMLNADCTPSISHLVDGVHTRQFMGYPLRRRQKAEINKCWPLLKAANVKTKLSVSGVGIDLKPALYG
jgi:hypothetical protein